MLRLSVCIALAAMLAGPALAGWRFAEWGMLPEEVIAASDGEASALEEPSVTGSGLIRRLRGRYDSDPYEFAVSYLFDPETGRLRRVSLRLRNRQASGPLYPALVETFGEPESFDIKPIGEGESHIAKWRDDVAGNRITYFAIEDYVAVEYAPLAVPPEF